MVAALLAADVPDVSPADRARSVAFVGQQIAALPPHLRAGVHAAGIAAAALGRRRAARAASRVARIGPLGEYVRLVRSLALFAVYEA